MNRRVSSLARRATVPPDLPSLRASFSTLGSSPRDGMGPSAVGLALLVLAASTGCSGGECSVDPRFPDEAVPALECASGTLCYRGACVAGCIAGRERTESCTSADDCSGSRPECVDGFCSACPSGETCIPVIDVCQPVSSVALPPQPEDPPFDRPRPPRPRDAGTLDDGLTRSRDAGAENPAMPRPVTHILFVDLGETENLIEAPDVQGSTIAVRSFDVRGSAAGLTWRPDVVPLATETPLDNDRDCELNRLTAASATVARPASFGRVLVDDAGDGGDDGAFIGDSVVAEWSPGADAYRIVRPIDLSGDLLNLSDFETLVSTFVNVTGDGVENVTDGTWPNPPASLHVPYDLRPEPETRNLLSEVQILGSIPVDDLEFRWERLGTTGVVATERVVVRIEGEAHEIVCRQSEGPNTPGAITVTAGLLEAFATAEGAAGREYPLYFERASAQQFQVNPDPERRGELRHFVSARVRHTFIGRVRF